MCLKPFVKHDGGSVMVSPSDVGYLVKKAMGGGSRLLQSTETQTHKQCSPYKPRRYNKTILQLFKIISKVAQEHKNTKTAG